MTVAILLLSLLAAPAASVDLQRLDLTALVTPSTIISQDSGVVTFAINGFVEFRTLAGLFEYVDAQAGRWEFASSEERQAFGDALLRRGVESRTISMVDERPLELLLTHTSEQVGNAALAVRTADAPLIFRGRNWSLSASVYRDAFLQVRARWKSSLNCWSASPSMSGRVLSNWYLIDEGIVLFGGVYDSTEHFWQAVKYHPDVRVRDLLEILAQLDRVDWSTWLQALDRDQQTALAHAYAIEFLKANLTDAHRAWFREQLAPYAVENARVRALQQRRADSRSEARFTALQEKTLWGDLADVFHLIHFFATLDNARFRTTALTPVLDSLVRFHFDGIDLEGYQPDTFRFISEEFRRLMLEIWKVKFLQIERFGDVIRSTAGIKLDHFLNDGDSPDIPIPIYVGYLNQIREMAVQRGR